MQKLSGLILDVYDDREGETIKQIFSDQNDVPDFIKSAHRLTEEERNRLGDDVFALILEDGSVSLRKYACIDGGNTALNVEYFLLHRDKLPEEAQKTAAANLQIACSWYGIEPPEELEQIKLGKVLGLGTLVTGAMAAPAIPEMAKSTKRGLRAVEDAGGHVLTPDQFAARKAQVM